MIEKYYAAHLKDVLDASAINVRNKKPPRKEVAEIRRGELETLRQVAQTMCENYWILLALGELRRIDGPMRAWRNW